MGYYDRMILMNKTAPPAGGTPVALTFNTVSGTFVESPAGKWGVGPGYGVATTVTLAASTNGLYQAEWQTFVQDTLIGLDPVSTATDYNSFDYAIGYGSGAAAYITGDAGTLTNSGIAAVAGDLIALRRTGSSITAEYFRSGSWTVIRTFSVTTTAQLYAKGNVAAATNYVYNPKVQSFT